MKNDLNVDQIKKLWILDLIVQSKSFKAAAARAKISPSAVSQSLSILEKNVGKTLLIREKNNIQPTKEAIDILNIVRPAFNIFDTLNNLEKSTTPKITSLNFGTYESIAIDILPGLINHLKTQIPKLKLGLRISRTDQLLTMLRKGELCSAIITEVDNINSFYKVEIYRDRLGLYISKNYLDNDTLEQILKNYNLGSLASSKSGPPLYYQRFLKKLGKIKLSVISESFEALRAATISGSIISILPQKVALRTNDLREITPSFIKPELSEHKIFVIGPKNCDRAEIDFLAAECKKLFIK